MVHRPARVSPALAVLSLLPAVLCGCGGGGGGPTTNAPSTSSLPSAVADAVTRGLPVDSGLVASNNAFGFDVFGQLVKADATQNVFVSPTSIALALEIVENGAKGDTLAGIAQALHLSGKSPADIDTANAALQASLVSTDPKVQLDIANSLWIHKASAQVLPAFLTANTTYYGSEIGDLAGAPANINAWASQHTEGKITSIVGPDDYNSLVAIIVNAVYFKGKWTMPFDPTYTKPTPFTRLDGTTTTAQMMNQSGTYSYYKGANFQVARLPYGAGRLSLIVALPDVGTDWNAFVAGLSGDALNAWIAGSKDAEGSVGLPRFQSEYSADLKTPLSTLGMAQAFDQKLADLTGIAPPTNGNIFIEYVKHKTFLKVDEEGTEAAAVTAVGTGSVGGSGSRFQMTMDHPFFCAIRDDKTGALLFMGVIVDPTAGGS